MRASVYSGFTLLSCGVMPSKNQRFSSGETKKKHGKKMSGFRGAEPVSAQDTILVHDRKQINGFRAARRRNEKATVKNTKDLWTLSYIYIYTSVLLLI